MRICPSTLASTEAGLHSTGGREAPHLQIVTYLRYVTIFMIDTVLKDIHIIYKDNQIR